MLMLLFRMVAFFQKAIFAWFIRCATSVLHCPVCYIVVPRYLYCKPLPFYIHLTLFLRCFLYNHFFGLLGIHCHTILFAGCIYLINHMLKLLLTLCQYDSVICISDVWDIVSIDVYSLSILQCFSYQVFRVYVEQTRWQYTTLSNTSLYCNFFRSFIFISHCGFLLEVNTFDYVYFFVWYSGFR